MPDAQFPSDFLWGAATASYQIEGAVAEDGRTPSVWDTFSHTEGKVVNGESGDVACDHYHRYPEDIVLLKNLGIPNYRFSVSWSRVLPNGIGEINQKGLDFYKRLVETLVENGISPAITLFHWDYPQVLQDLGGWSHPDSPKWFGDYADLIFKTFGDVVKHWITINEPWCYSFLGNGIGIHAPGLKDEKATYQVAHNLLIGHGEAVARFRAQDFPGEIGLTTNHYFGMPFSDTELDLKAKSQFDDWNAGWFLDPTYRGDYPEYLKTKYPMPEFTAETSKLVSQKTDFMGLNFYQGDKIKWNPEHRNDAEQVELRKDSTTQMGWQRVPETLTYTLVESQKRYNPAKIIVTENGCAYGDETDATGVHDPLRVEFLKSYLKAAHDAIEQGVNLKGYFVWSFMDNFEWAEGYRPTFGIVKVDYATQQRTPKDSALAYKKIVEQNCV